LIVVHTFDILIVILYVSLVHARLQSQSLVLQPTLIVLIAGEAGALERLLSGPTVVIALILEQLMGVHELVDLLVDHFVDQVVVVDGHV
jgi:hypothetical protein